MMKKWFLGFTIVELIVGMAICSILMLTVGVISRASIGSYGRLTKEAEVYNDLYSAVDFIERYARRHQGENVSWDSANQNFTVYVNDIALNNKEYNFSIVRKNVGGQISNLTFYETAHDVTTNSITKTNTTIMQNITNLNLNFTSLPNDALLNFTLNGTKDNVNFNRSISVLRRNT